MSDEPTTPASPASPASILPRAVGRAGLYATYIAAALFLLVCIGDLAVLVRRISPAGALALLVATGPLVALLLSTLASYVNYYGVWRVLRSKDEYDVKGDLKSHAADAPQAAQAWLAGWSGCLPAASTVLLFLSLLLVLASSLPPNTPVLGRLDIWNGQQGRPAPIAAATATPTPNSSAVTVPPLTKSTPTNAPSTGQNPGTALTPTSAPTPTPTPVVIKFVISPTSAFWNCTTQGTPAGMQTITLDNSGSNVAVMWSATPVERDAAGNPWAVFSPASGRIPAHGKQVMTITPDPQSSICVPSSQVSWHATIMANSAGTYTFTYTTSWIFG